MQQYNEFVRVDNKQLRRGYTTGSCATAAAKAATSMLLGGGTVEAVELLTPKGIPLTLAVKDCQVGEETVSCCVEKDSGDDPDVTDGIAVYATVSKAITKGITVDGGIGVGRVTKAGLQCEIGEAAINQMPHKMITEAVEAVCEELDYHGGIHVVISVPQGVEIAKRTYNPRLGIVGGISILGTTGIVEPMSEQALVEAIKVEMNVLKASGSERIVITPGNYGEVFATQTLKIDIKDAVKCSNFVGQVLDYAVELKFKKVLLIGHIGKFIKLAGGIMNTHSRYADCRMELFAAYAALNGATVETLKEIMQCVTTDDAYAKLLEVDLHKKVMADIMERIQFHIQARVYQELQIDAIVFSNKYGILGQTSKCL